ncbi:glycosyltransferase, partial [Phenylobacterium sp.]|uniref:glycosyltransferase n=1 Tax=Phenylobacterium sp. TaxID=1871053 RepID=UPI002E347140
MRFLFATFEGGGHVPPALMVARRLADDGHDVLLLSDEANRAAARAQTLSFTPWATAPNRLRAGQADDPVRDWRSAWPPAVVRAVCDAVITGPAARYAVDAAEVIDAFRPDIVVSNELLFGVMAAAEARSVPLALLTGNVWCFPTRPDLPPFGPGFPPARGRFGRGREQTSRKWIAGLYDAGRTDLNAARANLGLRPLARTLDQLDAADLILIGASQVFDYDASAPPPFAYAGPLIAVPEWAAARPPPDLAGDGPLVLVSFSTTFQNQAEIVARCIRALKKLPVRGLVTLGPAVDPKGLPSAPNVTVVESASHDAVMPHCAAVICHAGHGTVVRPLMNGVPVVCIPTGRDQPENAARIAWRG